MKLFKRLRKVEAEVAELKKESRLQKNNEKLKEFEKLINKSIEIDWCVMHNSNIATLNYVQPFNEIGKLLAVNLKGECFEFIIEFNSSVRLVSIYSDILINISELKLK